MRALVAFVIASTILCAGCMSTPIVRDRESSRAPAKATVAPGKDVARGRSVPPGRSTSPRRDVASLGIPPGHLPLPGQCRIWHPGQPPGHQPSSGKCWISDHQVPAGAWLLYRLPKEPKYVRVSMCSEKRPGVIVAVRIYDAKSGRFVRDE